VRRIYKSREPQALLNWKRGKPWRTSPEPWSRFPKGPKDAVRDQARSDQCGICCYCCGSIVGGEFHIEHFRPQSETAFPRLRYEWSNLLASCQSYRRDQVSGIPVDTQRHCGDHKEDWFVDGVTVDPQGAGVQACFRFPLSGKIFPSKALAPPEYSAVQETIERLNLQAPSLVARRANLLEQALKDASNLSEKAWRARYLSPSDDGTLPEFLSALKYTFDTKKAALFGS